MVFMLNTLTIWFASILLVIVFIRLCMLVSVWIILKNAHWLRLGTVIYYLAFAVILIGGLMRLV